MEPRKAAPWGAGHTGGGSPLPFTPAPLLCSSCRAGGLGGSSGCRGCASALGCWGGEHRVGWRGAAGFSCTRYVLGSWGPALLLGPPGSLVRPPTAELGGLELALLQEGDQASPPVDSGGNRTVPGAPELFPPGIMGTSRVHPRPSDFPPLSSCREVSAEPAPQLRAAPDPAAGSRGERDWDREQGAPAPRPAGAGGRGDGGHHVQQ